MNNYLKNLNRIEFVVTMACTGRCKHCSQGEHISNDRIDKDLAVNAIYKISKEYNINSVMTFGGEPLLCFETVCAIQNAAKEMNIPLRQLITNGYFSKDYEKINYVAQMLIDSGVNEILLSVDAFHQETIPLEYVKVFAKAVKKQNVKLYVHPAWLVSFDDNNSYNIMTRKLLDEFNKLDIESSGGNIIFPSGSAVNYLSEYFDLSKMKKNPYEEDPTDIHAICFSANGDVLNSNFYKQDIDDILTTYHPRKKIFGRK